VWSSDLVDATDTIFYFLHVMVSYKKVPFLCKTTLNTAEQLFSILLILNKQKRIVAMAWCIMNRLEVMYS
jgi:hypothetical protein